MIHTVLELELGTETGGGRFPSPVHARPLPIYFSKQAADHDEWV